MPSNTSKRDRTLTGSDFRALRHRIKENRGIGYSAEEFAAELHISPSLLQFIETNQRRITPDVAAAYHRVEKSFIFWMKDVDRVNAQTAAWLVDALVRHQADLSPRDRNRLRRALRSEG